MHEDLLARIQDLIEDYLAEQGIELVEIAYKRINGEMTLRLLVDTPNGIRMDECEGVNKFLSETLDREDVIEEHYVIEVSSPGLDRPIKTDRDFERTVGKEIRLTTYEPVEGSKSHEGKLIGMDAEKVVVENDGVSTVIPRNKIAGAKLKIEF